MVDGLEYPHKILHELLCELQRVTWQTSSFWQGKYCNIWQNPGWWVTIAYTHNVLVHQWDTVNCSPQLMKHVQLWTSRNHSSLAVWEQLLSWIERMSAFKVFLNLSCRRCTTSTSKVEARIDVAMIITWTTNLWSNMLIQNRVMVAMCSC